MILLFTLILTFATALVLAAPVAWLLMLFFGNLGVHIGFWGCVPGAILIGMLRTSVETKR